MEFNAKNWPAFLLIALTVVADQVSKYLILAEPKFNALGCLDKTQACGQVPVSGPIDLTMLWNRGMSFGLFQSDGIMRWVLTAIMITIAIGFAIWLTRARGWALATSLGLVVGGAIGNVIDRIRFGAVVDFIDASDLWFPYVFNVADAAISVGAVLLFLDQFLLSGRKQANMPDDI